MYYGTFIKQQKFKYREKIMSENNIELCVIGGGPGGYHASNRAAQLGLKTA